MTSSRFLFSVIIPTFDRPDMLASCLETLSPALRALPSGSHEVIVGDDGITASSESMLRERFPWVRWVAGHRRGPAANRNNAAKAATGEWLVFIDDDCLPAPDWLHAYATAAAPAASAPAPRLMEGRTLACGRRESIDTEAPINTHGGYLWSCNFAIRRELFLSMGGFDEGFPAPAMEDVELRVRLKKLGFAPTFVREALIEHPWRRRKGLPFLRAHARSVDYFARKHPDEAGLFAPASQLRILAARIARKIPEALKHHGGRGLARALWLDACTCVLVSTHTVRRKFLKKT